MSQKDLVFGVSRKLNSYFILFNIVMFSEMLNNEKKHRECVSLLGPVLLLMSLESNPVINESKCKILTGQALHHILIHIPKELESGVLEIWNSFPVWTAFKVSCC